VDIRIAKPLVPAPAARPADPVAPSLPLEGYARLARVDQLAHRMEVLLGEQSRDVREHASESLFDVSQVRSQRHASKDSKSLRPAVQRAGYHRRMAPLRSCPRSVLHPTSPIGPIGAGRTPLSPS